MFTDDHGAPFTGHFLDRLLHGLLLRHFPESVAKNYSWHSCRIWLATALLASGASRAQIQALCHLALTFENVSVFHAHALNIALLLAVDPPYRSRGSDETERPVGGSCTMALPVPWCLPRRLRYLRAQKGVGSPQRLRGERTAAAPAPRALTRIGFITIPRKRLYAVPRDPRFLAIGPMPVVHMTGPPCPRAGTTCPPCPTLGEREEHTDRCVEGCAVC